MYIIVNEAHGGTIEAVRKTQTGIIAHLQAMAVPGDHDEIKRKVRAVSRGKYGFKTISYHCKGGAHMQSKVYRVEGEE